MPHKYSSNGRVKKKPPASEGIAKSPGSGKFCFTPGSCQGRQKNNLNNVLHRDQSVF